MTMTLKLFFFISLALVAFAANSVLCRMALLENGTSRLMDPAAFTLIRLLSGALALLVLSMFSGTKKGTKTKLISMWHQGSWRSAWALFLYALGFSFAYVSLATGMGALILFGAVQMTLISLALLGGQRLGKAEWLGIALAFSGLIYLLLPTLATPSFFGFGLMLGAGVAWGVYTWRGKLAVSALDATASNFLRTLPLLIICLFLMDFSVEITGSGMVLAVMSGAITSGLGYAIWYQALGQISASTAAVLQLLVPIIAALGGVVFTGEKITLHLTVSALAVLGGVLCVVLGKMKKR